MLRMLSFVALASLLTGCVSISNERSDIDQAMWSRISAEYASEAGTPEADVRLTAIGEKLVPFAPESPDGPSSWSFYVLPSDEVQAFATIDGRVAVTRGLVELTESEDDLAAIVAQQIAHARLQHAWGFMINQINAAGFFIYPKGAVTEGGTRGAKVEYSSWLMHRDGVGFMHPFQGWQLIDADEAALVMLEGAGYDPRAVRWTLRLSASRPDTQYARCYGHVDERERAVVDWLAGHGEATASASDPRPAGSGAG